MTKHEPTCRHCKTTKMPRHRAYEVGWRELWECQAVCVRCGKHSKSITGKATREEAQAAALADLRGVTP